MLPFEHHFLGTVWMKYLVYLVMNNGEDSDERIHRSPVLEMWPALEEADAKEVMKWRQNLASPRLFSTHLPPQLLQTQVLQDKAKVVVIKGNVGVC